MNQHKAFNITATDIFVANEHPTLAEELAGIAEHTDGMLTAHKEDIIISYLKNHSIQTTWIAANPLLASLMTSNGLPTTTIEALFQAARSHPAFSKDLEALIRQSPTTTS